MAKRTKEVPMAETPSKSPKDEPASPDEMATLADDSARAILRKRLDALESKTILTIQDGAEIKRLRKALTQE